jgi:hypothetical protein
MAVTNIDITILEDGTISVTTGDIADTKHVSADALLDELADLAGGKKTTVKRENPFWKKRAVLRGGQVIKLRK